MEKTKFIRKKALKEASMISTIILILLILVMKFDNSIISILLNNLGVGIVIPILFILAICYIVAYSINNAYSKFDIKVKK